MKTRISQNTAPLKTVHEIPESQLASSCCLSSKGQQFFLCCTSYFFPKQKNMIIHKRSKTANSFISQGVTGNSCRFKENRGDIKMLNTEYDPRGAT